MAVLMLTVIGAGAYWIGTQGKWLRNRNDGRNTGVAGSPMTPVRCTAPLWIAVAVGAVSVAVLIAGPALFGPIGGPGLLGP